jgi:hypothetical protein
MKHSYRLDCDCARCVRERNRRISQAQARDTRHRSAPHRRPQRRRERRPVPGSQEWAETRGDDLGESPDY